MNTEVPRHGNNYIEYPEATENIFRRVSKLEADLAAETAAREEEDRRLGDRIDWEARVRKKEDDRLDARIDKEIYDRIQDVNEEESRAKTIEQRIIDWFKGPWTHRQLKDGKGGFTV
jgi:hypothetical protein